MGIKFDERRRYPRAGGVDVVATVVTRGNPSAACRVESLSAGGARLAGTVAPSRGECIQVLVGKAGSRPLSLTAEVVRVERLDDHEHVIAVKFFNTPDSIRDAIQRLVLRALERARTSARPAVLVVDESLDVQAALERDVNKLGLATISVSTSLDVVRCLHDPATKVTAALVDRRLGRVDGLVEYLADEHPHVRRVVMSERPDDLDNEVSSGRIHAALRKPWQRERLAEAIGRVVP